MPIAGYKGHGMALVNDILCDVLSGGLFGMDIPELQPDHAMIAGYCHFFMSLDISHFMPVVELKDRVDRIIHMMKSSRLAEGQDRTYLPGAIEFETHYQRIREDIPYSKGTINQLDKLAQELHIPLGF